MGMPANSQLGAVLLLKEQRQAAFGLKPIQMNPKVPAGCKSMRAAVARGASNKLGTNVALHEEAGWSPGTAKAFRLVGAK